MFSIFRLNYDKKNLNSKSDEELWALYCEHKKAIFIEPLFEKYAPLVYGVCLKYLPLEADSYDLMLHVFEKIMTDATHHQVSNFKHWLHSVTRNECMRHLQENKKEDVFKEKWLFLQNSSENFMENDPFSNHIFEQENKKDTALLEALKRLKEEQRFCLELFYFQNKTYKEIAEMYALTPDKVKSHIQNGKRNLSIILQDKFTEK